MATAAKRLQERALRTAGLSARSNVRIERDYNTVKPHILAYAQSLASLLQSIPGAGAVRMHVMDAAEVIDTLAKLPPISNDTVLTQETYLSLAPNLASLSVIYASPAGWAQAHQGIMEALNISAAPSAFVNLNRAAPAREMLEKIGCVVKHGDTHFPRIVYPVKTTVVKRPIRATISLIQEIDDIREWLVAMAEARFSDAAAQPIYLSLDRAASTLARIAGLFAHDASEATARSRMSAAQALSALEEEIRRLADSSINKKRLQELAGAVRQEIRLLEDMTEIWAEDISAAAPVIISQASIAQPLAELGVEAAATAPDAEKAPTPQPATQQAAPPPPPEPPPGPLPQAPQPEPPAEPAPQAPQERTDEEKRITMKDTMYFHRPGEDGIVDTLELIRKALDEVQTEHKKRKGAGKDA